MTREIHTIVIVGPREAAAAAAAFAISLRGGDFRIQFVQTPDDGAVPGYVRSRGGVAGFHQLLGIDEQALVDACGAYRLLGTVYRGFGENSADAVVPLGGHGKSLRLVDFHQYIAKLHAAGEDASYNEFSLPAVAGAQGSFEIGMAADNDVGRTVGFDICADSARYSDFMRKLATGHGVEVIESSASSASVDNGQVVAVELDNGEAVAGDFFVDCTRDRRIASGVIGEAGFQDWSAWMPCDATASVAVPDTSRGSLFATVEADDFGWTNRTYAGDWLFRDYAYSSDLLDDERACGNLAARVGSIEPADVRVNKRRRGRNDLHWGGNCVALGAASVSLEPMEVSSMHLLQRGVLRLLGMLPGRKASPALAEEFNRSMNVELDEIRDYQVLRYALAGRRQGAFWERLAVTEFPESLRRRIGLFRSHGRFTRGQRALFGKTHWLSSFVNFGFESESYDPIADMIDADRMRADIEHFRDSVSQLAKRKGT